MGGSKVQSGSVSAGKKRWDRGGEAYSVKRRRMEWSAKERGEWEETVAAAADVMEVGGEVKWKEEGGDNWEANGKRQKQTKDK